MLRCIVVQLKNVDGEVIAPWQFFYLRESLHST